MKNAILVNCTPSGSRVAVLEEGRLSEIYIEKPADQQLMGNIFKGRVTNIVPGMQCAFVDIGINRDLFLPLSDINLGEPKDFDPDAESSDDSEETISVKPQALISDILKVGQEIMVQVIKEPIGNKGPRGTTYLTLPGRYIVLMPTIRHLGISRRIEDPVEIARLTEFGQTLKPKDMGIIIRTVALGRSREELEEDLQFLLNLWESILKKEVAVPTPSLLHQESTLLLKVVRDLFNSSMESFLIDSKEHYEQLMSVCGFLTPGLKDKIRYYPKPDLMQFHGVEEDIHKAVDQRVSLPSGGYVIIQQTEALISIDVNTGSFIGVNNLEDTVYQTNLEAAIEIARQLRLRNLGGIIVIDFIDMDEVEHREDVFQVLNQECRKDKKTKYNIYPISELGIIQMTRQRTGQTLAHYLLDRCPYCKGKGKISSKDYICHKIYTELRKLCTSKHIKEVVLATCHPEVASILLERDQSKFKQLEEETNTKIFIRGDSSFHCEEFKFS
ncbi:MAG: Rne/Rng family ribonuclease [Candidatus Cloacimonetes bacterium]|nr:Rne/Rng family ribonuclease [Candidatus Cloacimonadota bacterium]